MFLVALVLGPGASIAAAQDNRSYVVGAKWTDDSWPSSAEGLPMDRAHLSLRLAPPKVARFFVDENLAGKPAIELNSQGLFVRSRALCVWAGERRPGSDPWGGDPPKRFDDATAPGTPCPADVPVRYVPGTGNVYVEIFRVNGNTAQIRFRGQSYYFNWQQSLNGSLSFPRKSPSLLGGLDVPAAFRPTTRNRTFSLRLREKANGASAIVATLTTLDIVDVFGIGNGTLLAAVYGRNGGWSLLRLVDGRLGWLAPDDAGKFMSLERLVRLDGTYVTPAWDRRLFTAPGSSGSVEVPHDPRRSWVGYLVEGKRTIEPDPLYDSPDLSKAPVARLIEDRHLTVETVNPVGVARLHYPIVFSTRPGWIELGLAGSSETHRPEGLRRVWLQDVPGRWVVQPVPPHEREPALSHEWGVEPPPAVQVLETRRVSGVLWLRVKVLAGDACEYVGDTLAEGWIPALRPNGRPTIWFEVCYA